jgi:hypothetical protein
MIGQPDGKLTLQGAAVDPGGSAECRASVTSLRGRELASLELSPDIPGTADLVGRVVGRGFRAAVDAICEPGTLASVLLCELPVAALLSGYASLYTGDFPDPIPDDILAGFPVDICAGWAAPASFMVQIRDQRSMPTPHGPDAPDLAGAGGGAGDSGGWHGMTALAPGSMRRQRLIERAGDEVWAMFRDSYAQLDGRVTVLHEYTVEARVHDVDATGATVLSCAATPRVLPWAECPNAAASASRVVGRHLADLRSMVKEEMVGTSTCTHLNDLLASLSQADRLAG